MIPITTEENKSYHKQNTCHICKSNLLLIIKDTTKSEIIVNTLENIEVLLIKCVA